jgi:hypothetical protein
MKKKPMGYRIVLGQVERNGMHLLAAKWDVSFSNVVTLALDAFLRQKLNKRDYEALTEDDFTNQLIGETINANRGVVGYDAEMNPIPKAKKHYFVPDSYEDMME